MKVRRKYDPLHGEHSVQVEMTHAYLTTDGSLLNKEYYEPVPDTERRWEDVTDAVQVYEVSHAKDPHDPGGVYVGDDKVASLQCRGRYRLRKVRMWDNSIGSSEKWVFLFERKVNS